MRYSRIRRCGERPRPRLRVRQKRRWSVTLRCQLPQRVSARRPARRATQSASSGLVVASLASTAGREHPASGTVASAAASEVRASLTLEGRSNLAGGAPASETCRPISRREVAGFPF
ncbi:hypothetical protein E2C01_012802 [Portunus trituberculatus]|uniref:Uncharacterized protein n=1 Tax=Portunus trituberculatus TaxID=210409 RepID=A0A5B7DEM9_PORTR|nr:hypothetical protein [Portunus trituberculatus]